ncbi:MAG: cytochrome bc complex cytochrome b subunit [Deltaproteobacteria bacterium]|nr:cytochrome bc complex cytochrome b subunit [Deltaproteobacteria bacterium]
MGRRIREWLEIRIGLNEIIRSQLTEYRVPKNINIFYTLGMVAFAAFLIQVLTGILLLFYYIPDEKNAFQSVQFIMNRVPYGWLFRLMHVAGSNLMVAVVLVHMGSVFFLGSYKKPRELTWVVGALLLLTTMGFCLSGYLLAWSQLSFWATTVVTTIPQAFPLVGDLASEIMRGGQHVSGPTLNRFFALHVAFLPLVLVLLFALHAFLVRRIGISTPPIGSEESQEWQEFHHESHPDGPAFYPDFVFKEVLMTVTYLVIMFAVISFVPALFIPGDATIPADPLNTPAHIRPEWYFLAPYEMLKLIPNRFLGIALQLVLLLVFIFWPFIDQAKKHNILKRPKLLAIFFVTIIVWIGLTIWGSR